MKKLVAMVAAASLVGVLGAAAPAKAADLCIQFSGMSCDLSGAAGFFRFPKAKFPKNNKKPVELHGRACETGTATGTMSMNFESNSIHLSAFYVCEATAGAFTADFSPASTAIGSTSTNAYASYGDVSLGSSCTATVVDCAIEGMIP